MGVQEVVSFLNKANPANVSNAIPEPVPPLPKKYAVPFEKKVQNGHIKTGGSIRMVSNLRKFDQNNTTDHPPTPPESPVATKKITSHVTPNSDLSRFDAIAAELVEMHSTLIQKTQDSDAYIQKLQSDVDKYASDVTKVRDYEIRVEYLAQKLEQLSEERDQLEEELSTLRRQGPPSKQQQQPATAAATTTTPAAVTGPLSPAFTQFFNQNQDLTIERTEKQNDEFMADFLNVYEEMPTVEDDGEENQNNSQDQSLFDEQQTSPQDEISVLNERLAECDKGVQMTIAKYVADIETQRLEVKRLKEVVKKQDELISKLELNLKSDADDLLREQVELQKIELDNKRELLSQLLNEREELLNRLRRFSSSSHRTSATDMLIAQMIQSNRTTTGEHKRPISYISTTSSSRHSSYIQQNGRGSPPPTAPPRQPLPPLPIRQESSLR